MVLSKTDFQSRFLYPTRLITPSRNKRLPQEATFKIKKRHEGQETRDLTREKQKQVLNQQLIK